ncbi:alpha/beta hydrolase [Photobacterium galatheae]|uniref:alpha/beta fold hydrolase n=1 Tax=Photobacterium galatheae TaxID=1654360 RepID=UPI00202D0AA5|nr:alpha/beta hydrolase [Photobacterium galatheae]MCM0147181.1 alpha/beta hydrolase [Photobacterium galatheae]
MSKKQRNIDEMKGKVMRQKLFLIPGTQCNERLWEKMASYLPPSFELVHLDIPGHMSFDDISDEYSQRLPDEKTNIIGFSLGGYIATDFAMKHPERVDKVFVISNSPTVLPPEELKQRGSVLQLVREYGYKGMTRRKAASMLDGRNQSDALIDIILDMDQALGAEVFLSQYQYTSERQDLSKALAEYSGRIHFYHSENDPLVDSTWLHALCYLNPSLTVTSISGSGHMLPLEKPRELANSITAWFEES